MVFEMRNEVVLEIPSSPATDWRGAGAAGAVGAVFGWPAEPVPKLVSSEAGDIKEYRGHIAMDFASALEHV